ncbi:hypothetical protein PIB30_036644 [Stylosanthes scabra]|uniref:PGG domain-containing protein n=1 Tax=Stylosanthes scabra TaxID=79078 RepID=A0ABU6UC73_9FABA|nr:hypothetical protein [Stylosanthes scabra]
MADEEIPRGEYQDSDTQEKENDDSLIDDPEYMDEEEEEAEKAIEFEPAKTIASDGPTRHSEFSENLELLGEVHHLARGGAGAALYSASTNILQEFKTPMNNTMLHLAALHGNDEMANRAAQQNPGLLFVPNKNNDTPLHVAARAGHVSTIRRLMDACVSNNNDLLELMRMENNQGNIMLHEAMMSGVMIFDVLEAYTSTSPETLFSMESCYELALKYANKAGHSVLYLAVESRFREAVNRILDKCSHSAIPEGISPLVLAIMKEDKDMMKNIVGKKQEWMHLRDKNGRVALHCAAATGYQEGVAFLLDICKNCSIQRDNYGYLPIHLAAHGGHVEVVKMLLKYCPDPNEMLVDKSLNNILHIAAKNGKIDLVRYILKTPELEKLINQKNMEGDTPLHLATKRGHPKIVYDLTWDSKVELDLLNLRKQTPLDIAIQKTKNADAPSLRQASTTCIKWVNLQSLTKIALKSAGPKAPHSVEAASNYVNGTERFKDRVESLSVISTLIITASVAACLAVPGDVDDEGTAKNLDKAMFHLFIFCITVSLFTSISATVILIWGRLGVIQLLNQAMKVAIPLIGIALVTLSLAFMAGIYTLISKLTWLATTFIVITAVLVAVIFFLYMLLFLPSSSASKFSRYISYYPFIFLASLAEKDPEEQHTNAVQYLSDNQLRGVKIYQAARTPADAAPNGDPNMGNFGGQNSPKQLWGPERGSPPQS